MSESLWHVPRFLMLAATMLLASIHAGSADDSYRNKTIRIIVGYGPGGGYDFYARILAAHIGDHIPGHPAVVVENMPGAGSVTAAKYVYASAPKDGTVIATVDYTALMHQSLGGIAAQFNNGPLEWLGSLAHSNSVEYTWCTSGIGTLEDAKTREVTLGSSGRTDDSYIFPIIVNALIGTKFKPILGYPDGSTVDIAIERGEIEGNGAANWLSLNTHHKAWVDQRKINILLQIGIEKDPELGDVPLLRDLVASDEGREISDLISVPPSIGYAYWVAPGVPADRLAILRAAFDETAKDPKVLEEATKSGTEIRPQSGGEISADVARIANTPKSVIDRADEMLNLQN